ncbi:MAG: hypothetical protein HFJ30_07925 [Clostridia bacterium]|nr:hypothetical protein [Clostridia bacterium]
MDYINITKEKIQTILIKKLIKIIFIGEEETKRYFETAYKFVSNHQNLVENYILSAKVHMDESTPHLHLVFIPVVKLKDKKRK